MALDNIAGEIAGAGDVLGAHHDSGDRGPGDIVQQKYNATLQGWGGKLKRGMFQVAASGFGKGVILAAVAFITLGALAAALVSPVPEIAMLDGGLRAMGFMLTTATGWMGLAAAGALGATAEAVGHQNKINAGRAEVLAKQYEQARQQEQERRLQPSLSKEPAVAPEKSLDKCELEQGKCFTAKLAQERAQQATKSPEGYGR